MATARSASVFRSKPGLAETLATRRPTKTRREKSSLSEDSVLSTLPSRTPTDCERERTTTASASSAPAARARSTSSLARSRSLEESISEDMSWPFIPVPFIVPATPHQGRNAAFSIRTVLSPPYSKVRPHDRARRSLFRTIAASGRRSHRGLRFPQARAWHRARLSGRRHHHRPVPASGHGCEGHLQRLGTGRRFPALHHRP
ncbi:hypothetical protein D3C72_1587360 [compost metagenome]